MMFYAVHTVMVHAQQLLKQMLVHVVLEPDKIVAAATTLTVMIQLFKNCAS
jgi:hypothetical protein